MDKVRLGMVGSRFAARLHLSNLSKLQTIGFALSCVRNQAPPLVRMRWILNLGLTSLWLETLRQSLRKRQRHAVSLPMQCVLMLVASIVLMFRLLQQRLLLVVLLPGTPLENNL